ncbi:MAG: SDR family NAD(P)-dependent oxidoreductase, partial [Chitinivibrionales bacterium]|nr:SDR family NAD(P)-dependent oxidoreductase [Chitinivibrionales bacterium]MBD3356547.1 SDR family NAD(P)-dependent oxidoreductase [Chitinivibrionales bacterium]
IPPSEPNAVNYELGCIEWVEPTLRRFSAENGSNQKKNGRIWLVLDTDYDYAAELKRTLDAREGINVPRIIRVRKGTAFQSFGNVSYAIRPNNAEDFRTLLRSLHESALIPDTILCLWSLDSQGLENSLWQRQNGVEFLPLFHLIQTISVSAKEMHAGPPKDTKGISLYNFYLGNDTGRPFCSALSGFMRSIHLENPAWKFKNIEMNAISNRAVEPSSAAVRLICREIMDEVDSNVEVLYQSDGKSAEKRLVRELTVVSKNSSNRTDLERAPIKTKGVYLITGGMGGLGIIFAEYLASEYQAHLVLTGGKELTSRYREILKGLRGFGTKVIYVPADISKADDVKALMSKTINTFGCLHGILHAADFSRDNFFINKSAEESAAVLEPKVRGTILLDNATRTMSLDLFVLFSSVAAVTGSAGQCDYAYANGFMDGFAEYRNRLVQRGLRKGKTLSINWPLWAEGGAASKKEEQEVVFANSGMMAMPAKVGLTAFEEALNGFNSRYMVCFGEPSTRDELSQNRMFRGESTNNADDKFIDRERLVVETRKQLHRIVSEITGFPFEELQAETTFRELGVDSFMIKKFNLELEKMIGPIPATLLYEFENIDQLSNHLADNYAHAMNMLVEPRSSSFIPARLHDKDYSNPTNIAPGKSTMVRHAYTEQDERRSMDIAIIGISGRYPGADTLEDFWENLSAGRDATREVPTDRWDADHFYHQDPARAAEGSIYAKWGGFLNDVDKFDPLFFNISPKEAEAMDPQERLFLETTWNVLDNAHYTGMRLALLEPDQACPRVGVFAGITTNTYLLYGPEQWEKGNTNLPSSLPWSVVNRVSYFFNFCDPSMAVDTACSSSLSAIHLACESLRRNECVMAVAGGVNLYLHPAKYLSMCQMNMLSPTGKSYTFGNAADGFVPGEGVGALLLKPLWRAEADGDTIHAVIKGSGLNHGGKTMGYTVPNPNAHADLIGSVLSQTGIEPETISCY